MRQATCLPWNTEGIAACDGEPYYVDLDLNMTVSDTENCISLCKQQGDNGCCGLDNTFGCWWQKDGIPILPFIQTVVQCSPAGMFVAV